jgi:hypothetical protein
MTRIETILAATLLVAVPALSDAQTPAAAPEPRIQTAASVGYGKTWDDEGSVGNGRVASVGMHYDFGAGVSVGATVERVHHFRETSFGAHTFSGDSTMVTADALVTFGTGRVRPLVRAGAGVLVYSGHATSGAPRDLPAAARVSGVPTRPTETFEHSGTTPVTSVMAGLDVRLTRTLSVRPDFTFHLTRPHHDWMPWIVYGGGVGMAVRW